MSPSVRAFVAFAATFAVVACPVVIGGCASKPPQPEPTPQATPDQQPAADASAATDSPSKRGDAAVVKKNSPTESGGATPSLPPPKPDATASNAVGPAKGLDESASSDGRPRETRQDTASGAKGARAQPDDLVAATRDSSVAHGQAATAHKNSPFAHGQAATVHKDSPMAHGQVATAQVRPSVAPAAQTADERRAVLDKRLNDSLGAFDAQLRREQQKIAQERDARQASVTTVATADGSEANNGELIHGRSNDGPDSGDRPGSGDLRSEKAAAAGGGSAVPGAGDGNSAAGGAGTANAGNGAVANEIPDGNDDDVVAHRLRKAAEQETDPELKDKLWKEYAEYKKNTHAR